MSEELLAMSQEDKPNIAKIGITAFDVFNKKVFLLIFSLLSEDLFFFI